MVVVAVAAVFLAARAEIARWEEKRRRYEILSEVYSDNQRPQRTWCKSERGAGILGTPRKDGASCDVR